MLNARTLDHRLREYLRNEAQSGVEVRKTPSHIGKALERGRRTDKLRKQERTPFDMVRESFLRFVSLVLISSFSAPGAHLKYVKI